MSPRARVIRVAGPSATLVLDGATVEANIDRRTAERPVAGDWALVRTAEDGTVTVIGIEERTSALLRAGARDGSAKTLVANADLIIIFATATEPPLRPRLVDRYLVSGHVGGLEPAIIVTKVDLPHDPADVAAFVERYRGIGYPVLVGSAKDPALHAQVAALIGDRTAVLAGHSGVGKSTLTRGLTGVEREVGEVSKKRGTGRHTTTDPRLIPLSSGHGAVIDTAGVRTFFLPKLEPREIADAFPEIARAAPDCRFDDCKHTGEAGCAVVGRISPERLESYRLLLEAWPLGA